jgi:hypothetical protein
MVNGRVDNVKPVWKRATVEPYVKERRRPASAV